METQTVVRQPLIEVRNLVVRFPVRGGLFSQKIQALRAVEDVSFTISKGETLGLVGESGCGKTTVALSVVRILKAMVQGVEMEGEIIFHTAEGPLDLIKLRRREMRPLRSRIQMVFQDPFSSLNPRMTVGQLLENPLCLHTGLTRRQRTVRAAEILERVGLQPDYINRYPHEFSGGQRQRIGIAQALAAEPELVVLDEPVSALDVSVQAQVINLLQDLQDKFGLTYLFIAHDLSIVYHISDRIAVMYLGNMVEIGDAEAVYNKPEHPYTRALLSSVPHPDPGFDYSGEIKLSGEIPSLLNKPDGCSFRTRCPVARNECATLIPTLQPKPGGQLVACPFTGEKVN